MAPIRISGGAFALLCCTSLAHAEGFFGADQGKLQLTAGFSQVEGAGGGGLTPWALITGYGSRNSWGANGHFTTVQAGDFQLDSLGVAAGLFDRFELSYTNHDFDVTGTALDGLNVEQDIYGLKVRLVGDAVYDQHRFLPQVAVGAQYKSHGGISDAAGTGNAGLVSPTQLGAADDDGTDYYLSATKVYLAQSLLLNATVRYTKANQFGLLGFGGDGDDDYSAEFEGTLAYLISRKFAVGAEYRTKPDNLAVDEEGDAWDVYAAWTPTKNISFLGAYVNLGEILSPLTAETGDQDGAYLSFQIGF